jgi:Tol biopolymer transport system component
MFMSIKVRLSAMTILFVFLLGLLTTTDALYSATSEQSSPTVEESLPYLPLDHYDVDPRTFLETEPSQSPQIPTSPDYLSWGKVVYQSYRQDSWDIFISNDGGSYETALATTGRDEIHPRLNRGGTRVVYAIKEDGDYEIYVMNSNGTGKTRLTNNNTDDVSPYWSPDGSQLVFQAYRNGQPEIYVMNANGSNQTRLTNSSDYDGMPSWSPNGSTIAFVSRRTGGYRIYTMGTNGSNQTQLSNQAFSLEPAWSPDSTQITYTGDGDNNTWFEVWMMNANGSGQTQKYNPGNSYDARVGSWSPDGLYLAFTRIRYIFYQGNWYWTESHLRAIGVSSGSLISVGPNVHPYRDWTPDWQTLDNQSPSTQVNALASVTPGNFAVTWGGSDQGGSGLKNYDVQIRDGANGTWTNWKTGVTITSATYSGIGGHTYYFRSRARDYAANLEAWPATHDAVTTVEALPPNTAVNPLPAFSRANQPLQVSWGGSDSGGSTIVSYDVQYRVGNGAWQNWLTGTQLTGAAYTNTTSGFTVYFRSRATDSAQNTEAWPAGDGDTKTTFYVWSLSGVIQDIREVPVANALVQVTPAAVSALPTNANGQYIAYMGNSPTYQVSWSKTGYLALPLTQFQSTVDRTANIFLPPANNLIADWGFENANPTTSWILSGTITPTLTTNPIHTGQQALQLGSLPLQTLDNLPQNNSAAASSLLTDTNDSTVAQQITIPTDMPNPTLSYLYQLGGATTGSGLTVLLDNGSGPVIVQTITQNESSWKHNWLDLSVWAGQTVTLTFRTNEVVGGSTVWAYLDEITVGSVYADLWVNIAGPTVVNPGRTAIFNLTYGNQGGVDVNSGTVTVTLPVGLSYVTAVPAPVSTSPLVWNVGPMLAGSGPFTIQLTLQAVGTAPNPPTVNMITAIGGAIEVENANNSITVPLYIGWRSLLPLVVKP